MKKNQFKFYKSYWDIFNQLNSDKEKVEFIEILNNVHFFNQHINSIKPKTQNLKLAFASIKHSLEASIKGYCDKLNIDYDDYNFTYPYQGGKQGGSEPPYQQYIKNNKQYTINNKEKINKKEKYNPAQDLYFFYDEDFQLVWKDFLYVRDRKKAAKSDRAIRDRISELKELSSYDKDLAIEIVKQSADSGWIKFYPLKQQKNNVNSPYNKY